LVLTIAPNHPAACLSLSQMLRQMGQPAEAVRQARRAARLTRNQNLEILLGLAEAYADARRFAEARDTAEEALKLAQLNAPQLVPEIRRRLGEYRSKATPG
jgi:Flp pilus assembly protein TadD